MSEQADVCSVRFVGGGSGAEEVWQCTQYIGVGGQRSHQTVKEEQQHLPRDRWCVESVGELLADTETSRDTSAF